MRNDEEFKKEVFKRCEIMKRMEEIRKRKLIGSLCILVIVCVVAIPVMLNNNSVPEPNGVDMSVDESAEENISENAADNTFKTDEDQIAIDTGLPLEEQDWGNESATELFCKIVNIEHGETAILSSEKTGELFSLLESVYDTKDERITAESERNVKFEITISSSSGEERYFISSDGYIKKGEDSQWKSISEEKQQEIENFILGNFP